MDELPVEVEYKFKIPEDIKDRLSSIRAELIKDSTFTDVYLDTEDYVLSFSDTWLRRRNGRYQLKYAAPKKIKCDICQYKETDDIELIQQYVSNIITNPSPTHSTATKIYDMNKLIPFAEIVTHRTKYKLEKVVIDLDQTDFGYSIGEVEVMSTGGDGLQDAIDKVKLTMSLLGVQMLDVPSSKLMAYLSIHNKPLRDQLFSKLGI